MLIWEKSQFPVQCGDGKNEEHLWHGGDMACDNLQK